jgi:hypothetical protein
LTDYITGHRTAVSFQVGRSLPSNGIKWVVIEWVEVAIEGPHAENQSGDYEHTQKDEGEGS